MSRLSNRQHRRKHLRASQAEATRLNNIETGKAFIAAFKEAGEKERHPFRDYPPKMARDKKLHDIVLFDGTMHQRCYPNASSWFPWTKGGGRTIKDSEVALVRMSKIQMGCDEEEEVEAHS